MIITANLFYLKPNPPIAVAPDVNLRDLLSRPTPESVQIWHCEPLVIVDDEGNFAFVGSAEVEFTPESGSDQIGQVAMTKATKEGWLPQMTVKARFERMDHVPDLRFGMRSGFTLVGEDEEGNAFEWYINGAADLLLTQKPSVENPTETE